MKFKFITIITLLIAGTISAQNDNKKNISSQLPETYINVTLETKEKIALLAKDFNIDKVSYDTKENNYQVRVWLPQRQYDDFEKLGIPYQLCEPERPAIQMATTVDEMFQWNRYPTYETYTALMDTFQKRFPDLCHIDTILAATPNGHALLAAHITANVNTPNCRPQFFYTSTMHGDEVTGYYCMLRLIDHLLTNYLTDVQVTRIIDNFDLWVCPVENPDGTYRTSNNTLGNSPTSTRANSNGVDLNRSYPGPNMNISNLEPEVAAMVAFAGNHRFVMSANYHGGSELANYPWDTWASSKKRHADDAWWAYVSRLYADTVHSHSTNYYFYDMNNGITFGGDWYVVDGSRQDYMNYKQHCREITMEISTQKAPSSSDVDKFWQYNRQAMLNYIEEAGHGFHGAVTDITTGKAIEATVFINGHDSLNSEVITSTDSINYYRPIKAGSYSITFSAEGYCSETTEVTTADGASVRLDMALWPLPCDSTTTPIDTTDPVIDNPDSTSITDFQIANTITIYPNPAKEKIFIKGNISSQKIHYQYFDIYGKLISEGETQPEKAIELNSLPAGIYFLRIKTEKQGQKTFKIIKQ